MSIETNEGGEITEQNVERNCYIKFAEEENNKQKNQRNAKRNSNFSVNLLITKWIKIGISKLKIV